MCSCSEPVWDDVREAAAEKISGIICMKDHFGRSIDYMRISITDRCNLRCRYCMPDGCDKVSMSQILTYEEIIRICRISTRLGIRKLKVTGGEPFVRLGCTDLIRSLKLIDGIEE